MGERVCVWGGGGGECGFTSSKASSALSSLVVMFAYVGGMLKSMLCIYMPCALNGT